MKENKEDKENKAYVIDGNKDISELIFLSYFEDSIEQSPFLKKDESDYLFLLD